MTYSIKLGPEPLKFSIESLSGKEKGISHALANAWETVYFCLWIILRIVFIDHFQALSISINFFIVYYYYYCVQIKSLRGMLVQSPVCDRATLVKSNIKATI